jgi:hypothetical protein
MGPGSIVGDLPIETIATSTEDTGTDTDEWEIISSCGFSVTVEDPGKYFTQLLTSISKEAVPAEAGGDSITAELKIQIWDTINDVLFEDGPVVSRSLTENSERYFSAATFETTNPLPAGTYAIRGMMRRADADADSLIVSHGATMSAWPLVGAAGAPGAAGSDGADGADGIGLPPGGAVGQIPVKVSLVDGDIEWQNPTGGSGAGLTGIQDLFALGAVGNDSTNNTAVFTAMAAAGGTYTLPPGIYRTDRFTTNRNLTIIGIPDPVTGALPEIKCRTAITGMQGFILVNGPRRFEMRNVRLTGGGFSATAVYAALYCEGARYVTLDNVDIENWASVTTSAAPFSGVYIRNLGSQVEFKARQVRFFNLYNAGPQACYGFFFHTYSSTGYLVGYDSTYDVEGCRFKNIYSLANGVGGSDDAGVARGIESRGGGNYHIKGCYFNDIHSCDVTKTPTPEDADHMSFDGTESNFTFVLAEAIIFDGIAKRGLKFQHANPDSVCVLDGFTATGGWGTTPNRAGWSVISAYGGHVTARNGRVMGPGKMATFCEAGNSYFRSLVVENVTMDAGRCKVGETYLMSPGVSASSFGFILVIGGNHSPTATINVKNCRAFTGGYSFMARRGLTLNVVDSYIVNDNYEHTNSCILQLSGDSTETAPPSKISFVNSYIAAYQHMFRDVQPGSRTRLRLLGCTFKNLWAQRITSLTSTWVDPVRTATCVTEAPHLLNTGNTVRIFGADQSAYNVTATVTVINSTTFTYPVTGSSSTPVTPATFAWEGTARKNNANYVVSQALSKAYEIMGAYDCTSFDFDRFGFLTSEPFNKDSANVIQIRANAGAVVW